MENHHFSWEKSLFLWWFSIATLNSQRVYDNIIFHLKHCSILLWDGYRHLFDPYVFWIFFTFGEHIETHRKYLVVNYTQFFVGWFTLATSELTLLIPLNSPGLYRTYDSWDKQQVELSIWLQTYLVSCDLSLRSQVERRRFYSFGEWTHLIHVHLGHRVEALKNPWDT